MMNIKNLMKSSISVFLIFSLILPLGGVSATAAESAPKQKASQLISLEIPQEFGTIQSQHINSKSDKSIILIQDAHAVIQAQENMYELIKWFQQEKGVNLITFEGAKGKVDATLLRAFPDQKIKQKVLGEFLSRGEITGIELAAIFSSHEADYLGVENLKLYADNFFAYQKVLESQAEDNKKLEVFHQALDQQREEVYSKELNEFHKNVSEFFDNRSNLIDLLSYLSSLEGVDKQLSSYPQLKQLFDLVQKDKVLNQNDITNEVVDLANEVKRQHLSEISAEMRKEFNHAFQQLITESILPRNFLAFLSQFCEKNQIPLVLTPGLEDVLQWSQQFEQVQGVVLFEELRRFIKQTEEQLITQNEETEITRQYRQAALLEKLLALKWTPDQYAQYQESPTTYRHLAKKIGVKDLTRYVDFYNLAKQRDAVLIQNVISAMDQRGEKTAVLVVGGFHSSGIEALLKQQGYSYGIIAPRIQSLAGHELYASLMQGQYSYRDQFKSNLYDSFLHVVTQNLLQEIPDSEEKVKVKIWRDEIIRSLAKKKSLVNTKQYTQYLDSESLDIDKEDLIETIKTSFSNFQKSMFSNNPNAGVISSVLATVIYPQAHPLVVPGKDASRSSADIEEFLVGTVSAQSLGNISGLSDVLTAVDGEDVPSLSASLKFQMAHDGFHQQLNEGALDLDRREELLGQFEGFSPERMIGVFNKAHDVMTDSGTAFHVLMEKAKDEMFKTGEVEMGMVSVPMSGANTIGKEFGIKGFADIVKGVVNEVLKTKFSGVPMAQIKETRQSKSAYMGTRIVLLDAGKSPVFAEKLLGVMEEVKRRIREEFTTQIADGKDPAKFQMLIGKLPFFSSHNTVHMYKEKVNQTEYVHRPGLVTRKNRGDLKDYQNEMKKIQDKSENEQNDFYVAYDDALRTVRARTSSAARYWFKKNEEEKRTLGRLRRDLGRAEGLRREPIRLEIEKLLASKSRANASHFLDVLLVDHVNKLNERLEAFEKIVNPTLRQIIDDEVFFEYREDGDTPSQEEINHKKATEIGVMDDEKISAIKKELIKILAKKDGVQGENLLAVLFHAFQDGRGKTPPPLNFFDQRLLRFVDNLNHIYSPKEDLEEYERQAEIKREKASYLTKLLFARKQLVESLRSNDSEEVITERLEKYNQHYRNYRLMLEYAFIRAYRDPRFELFYKLRAISEIAETDAEGLIGLWKEHVLKRNELEAWNQQKSVLVEQGKIPLLKVDGEAILDDYMDLVVPGFYLYKRPVGDELGVLIFEKETGTLRLYRNGFLEGNKMNAFFEENYPDGQDSTYHKMALELYEVALKAYSEGSKDKKLGVLKFFTDISEAVQTKVAALEGVTSRYATTEKVVHQGITVRMPSFQPAVWLFEGGAEEGVKSLIPLLPPQVLISHVEGESLQRDFMIEIITVAKDHTLLFKAINDEMAIALVGKDRLSDKKVPASMYAEVARDMLSEISIEQIVDAFIEAKQTSRIPLNLILTETFVSPDKIDEILTKIISNINEDNYDQLIDKEDPDDPQFARNPRDGVVYYREFIGEPWYEIRLKFDPNERELWPRFRALYTIAPTVMTELVDPTVVDVEKLFDLMDDINGEQKKTDSIRAVATDLEIIAERPGIVKKSDEVRALLLRVNQQTPEQIDAVVGLREVVEAIAGSSLGKPLDERVEIAFNRVVKTIAREPSSEAILQFVASNQLPEALGKSLGSDSDAVSVPEIVSGIKTDIRSRFGPNVFDEDVPAQELVRLSFEARTLLNDLELLNEISREQMGIVIADDVAEQGQNTFVLDASFLPREGDIRLEQTEFFIDRLIENGDDVVLSYSRQEALNQQAAIGLRSLVGTVVRLAPYRDNTLRGKNLSIVSEPIMVLPKGIGLGSKEGSDWKEKGVVADPSLTHPSQHNFSDFVLLTKLILNSQHLRGKFQIDPETGMIYVNKKGLNSIVSLLNTLAKHRKALAAAEASA